jgi:nuclear cap-binding protein subunit 2
MRSAVSLYGIGEPEVSEYYDKRSKLSRDEYFDRLKVSTTLYVGNLSFKTMEH